MSVFISFMAIYGLCFGLREKATFLREKHDLLDRFLDCVYCVGLPCGGVVWLAGVLLKGEWPSDNPAVCLVHALLWAFSGGAFSYAVDTSLQAVEHVSSVFYNFVRLLALSHGLIDDDDVEV